MIETNEFAAFRKLSAELGQNPLRVQGPGGNTSIKDGGTMWIKASGTELAEAEEKDIFVAVDRAAAKAEAEGAGDGSCKDAVIDKSHGLRPSIETTFHAVLDWPVVAHTHSIATLTHAVSVQGRQALAEKLSGLPFVQVPYAKPGLPLTRQIMSAAAPETQVIVLQNHGLICAGADTAETSALMEEVERRLAMPPENARDIAPTQTAPRGFNWARESWLATDEVAAKRARAGSYYPDHVVFLGPGLPVADHAGNPPAILVPGEGVAIRSGATASQQAMLSCLADLLARVPVEWDMDVIGDAAEAELLNWDAEKYRQALAARA